MILDKLMELADDYAALQSNWDAGHTSQNTPHLVEKARRALQEALQEILNETNWNRL